MKPNTIYLHYKIENKDMINSNEYFEGNVKTLGFTTSEGNPTKVGIIQSKISCVNASELEALLRAVEG